MVNVNSAVTQWMATKSVWISLSHGPGIEVKHRHICMVRVIKRLEIVDVFVAAYRQMGLRNLQLQKIWVNEPKSGQPRKHCRDTVGYIEWSFGGVIYHLV